MAGYRDTSNYDPYASPGYSRPLRPFNWVQWIGVGFVAIGIALDLAYFAGRVSEHRTWVNPTFAVPVLLIGVSLVNSRREEPTDLAPELAAARKRWLLIVVAICAVVLGAAIAISSLKGA